MNSKAYSSRNVNLIQLNSFLKDRSGQDLWVGVDVGKEQMQVVLNWAGNDFERPWKVSNPSQVRLLVDHLKQLSIGRKLIVALEPSGTYGDVLRQACGDAQIVVHRVSPKAAHDYAEVFDGVPSQHDGKDAAVVAELARLGKSVAWPLIAAPVAHQQIEYWVDRMDGQRRLLQMWCGRIEGRMARHWPEMLRHLKTTSLTMLKALIEYAGPAELFADPEAAGKLKRWGGRRLRPEKIKQIVDDAKQTVGVRQTPVDQQRLRDYATEALSAKLQIKQAQNHLRELSRDIQPIQAQTPAIGNATAALQLGDDDVGDPAEYRDDLAKVVPVAGPSVQQHDGGRAPRPEAVEGQPKPVNGRAA